MEIDYSEGQNLIDQVPPPKECIDDAWLKEHLNMEIALRAYEQGIRDPALGPSKVAVGTGKLELIDQKIIVHHLNGAVFPLTDEEIRDTLCHFPESWLFHAKLKSITVRCPALFLTKKYGEHHFVAGIEEMYGKRLFEGDESEISPPVSVFHYAPGQYVGSDQNILLYEEPNPVKEAVEIEARRQYGRELIVHEFLHSVLKEDAKLQFVMNGVPHSYASIMEEFHQICQRERAATSEYSELYSPLISLPFNLEDFWVKMGLQEELGELLSSTILGWGATPKGKAMKVTDRDFGGEAFHKLGKSEKLAFAERLRTAVVIGSEIEKTQLDTARSVENADQE